MLVKRIRKTDVEPWLGSLTDQADVFVPTERAEGEIVFDKLEEGNLRLDYGRPVESLKRLLFSQMEPILRWKGADVEPVVDQKPRIVFGVRPCDAAALLILDEFFRRNFVDPYYHERRLHMRLIVMVCERSEESCFCSRTGTGPVAAEGFDLQMLPDGDSLLIWTGSDAGEKMIARDKRFTKAPDDWEQRRDALAERVSAEQPDLDFARAAQIIRDHEEPEGFWEDVAAQCLVCGGCAYLCPTCTCFTFFDRPDKGSGSTGSPPRATSRGGGDTDSGQRLRTWDSCILEGFTREASAHNPYPSAHLRCARRYVHKLTGSDLPSLPFRCVGCGRCVDACISHLGMIKVIRELLQGAEVPRHDP